MDNALDRLDLEGVTEQALIFTDPLTGCSVQVTKISTQLIVAVNESELQILETASPEQFLTLQNVSGGIALASGAGRSWPIEILLLHQGAAYNYFFQIQHLEASQSPLFTPKGTSIQGL